jgi:small subunit ribosomal protein S17
VSEPAGDTAPLADEVAHSGRRRLIGQVRSDKMDKTIVVEVVRYKMHTMYKKYVKVRKRYKVHDEKNEYRLGDRVEIVEARPMSKDKRFRAVRLIERPALAE